MTSLKSQEYDSLRSLIPQENHLKINARTQVPYVLLVRGKVLVEIHDLIEKLLKNRDQNEGDTMTVNALKMLEANLSWLLISKIDPEEVGVSMKSKKETLSSTLRMLEELIQNKQQDVDKAIVRVFFFYNITHEFSRTLIQKKKINTGTTSYSGMGCRSGAFLSHQRSQRILGKVSK